MNNRKLIIGNVYTVWNDGDVYKKNRLFQGYYGRTLKFVEYSNQLSQPLITGETFDNYENPVMSTIEV
jgi:hypothetical protein